MKTQLHSDKEIMEVFKAFGLDTENKREHFRYGNIAAYPALSDTSLITINNQTKGKENACVE